MSSSKALSPRHQDNIITFNFHTSVLMAYIQRALGEVARRGRGPGQQQQQQQQVPLPERVLLV